MKSTFPSLCVQVWDVRVQQWEAPAQQWEAPVQQWEVPAQLHPGTPPSLHQLLLTYSPLVSLLVLTSLLWVHLVGRSPSQATIPPPGTPSLLLSPRQLICYLEVKQWTFSLDSRLTWTLSLAASQPRQVVSQRRWTCFQQQELLRLRQILILQVLFGVECKLYCTSVICNLVSQKGSCAISFKSVYVQGFLQNLLMAICTLYRPPVVGSALKPKQKQLRVDEKSYLLKRQIRLIYKM